MKIAITADVHLTARSRHPERYEALETILSALREQGIEQIIIAGDLFDASQRNYAEFEALCTRPEYAGLRLTIIRGNHDVELRSSHLAAGNVRIVDEPAIVSFAPETSPFLLIPYSKEKSMGEVAAPFAPRLAPDDWVLVGHGDWMGGQHAANAYEPGVYMPLTRSDVERLRPANIFLGHIHAPLSRPPLYYAGSPCGLDVTETGQRRFLLYDLPSGEVSSQRVAAPVLYFDEKFVIVPADDEAELLRRQIRERIAGWQLQPGDAAKTRVRVRVSGYSAAKRALPDVIRQEFAGICFYQDAAPDLSEVYIAEDLELATIAEQARRGIQEMVWPHEPGEPSFDEIMLDALHLIYGSAW